jgi:hypothetical protein
MEGRPTRPGFSLEMIGGSTGGRRQFTKRTRYMGYVWIYRVFNMGGSINGGSPIARWYRNHGWIILPYIV